MGFTLSESHHTMVKLRILSAQSTKGYKMKNWQAVALTIILFIVAQLVFGYYK